MDPEVPRLSSLFGQLLDMPSGERGAFLTRACPDPRERRRVEALFESYEAAGDFLEVEEGAAPTPLAKAADALSMTGRMVGPYRVVGRLGAGGMGVVYEAQQERPRRRVALKLLGEGSLTPSAMRRFRHEAEMLGRLRHPGIAQIIEAGTADLGEGQRPYFAMELVHGVPLVEFVKRRGASIRERLALFLKVCDAVEHAHQKGVIHRDLKPENILVETRAAGGGGAGEEAQPKILDFGVARATDTDLRMTTIGAEIGTLIGTVVYMSPEQVRGDSSAIDARADVYALGVVLYEMLTERLPFDVRSKPIAEVMRIVAESSPAPPTTFSRALRGDLSTIITTAMAKPPARRYQSVSALADDVRRFLRHEPITARPPSALYTLGRFARRHRVLSAGAAGVALVMVASMVMINDARLKAVKARAEAERQYEEARRISSYFLNDLMSRPDILPRSLETREELLTQILLQTREQLDRRPNDPVLLNNHARALIAMADQLRDLRRYDEVRALVGEAVEVRRRIVGLLPNDPWQRMLYGEALSLSVGHGHEHDRDADPIPVYIEIAEIDAGLVEAYPESRRYLDNLYWSYARIAQSHLHQQSAEAGAWVALGLRTAHELLARFPDHFLTRFSASDAHLNASRFAELQGDWDEALAHAARAESHAQGLLSDHPDSRDFMHHKTRVQSQKGRLHLGLGDYDSAEAAQREVLAVVRRLTEAETTHARWLSARDSALRQLALIDSMRAAGED